MSFSFVDHVALLEQFVSSRHAITDALERRLFSARGKAAALHGDRGWIADTFNGCFFESPSVPQRLSGLNGQLDAARLADGFEPARHDGYARGLDPSELVLRACHHWQSSRWPGRNGRFVFAQSLYAAFLLHQLEQLSLRIWDEGRDNATDRLHHLQHLLDASNAGRAPQGVLLVRDARWLIQTAQGPLTTHARPYFVVADHVSQSFADIDRLEIHKAGAVLAGGHLRSQLRHASRQTGWAFDDPRLVALTRSSNSMDIALLVRDLVPLLEAYAAACMQRNNEERLALADAILQGLSADPELLLTRLDLLRLSTTIGDVDVDRECLARYGELVAAGVESLQYDSAAVNPADAAYSPFGIVHGFCADLIANMVLSTLRPARASDLSLEDVFISRERLEEKAAQAHEWERLPKRQGEPNAFEHSAEWAAQMYARLARALEARATHPAEPNASGVRKSYLYVAPHGMTSDALSAAALPAAIVPAQEHCLTSDVTWARNSGATALSADRLVADRADGRLLACVRAESAWFGISKIPLTLFVGQGKDALITDVPLSVIAVLRTACPEFLVVVE